MAAGDGGEVVAQLGVGLIERRLNRRGERLEDAPRPVVTATEVPCAKMNACRRRGVEVGDEDLRLPGRRRVVAEEQLVRLECGLRRDADNALRRLAHDELERLVTPEEHLLQLPSVRGSESWREAKEDAEPALVADRGDVGRDAHGSTAQSTVCPVPKNMR